MKTEFRTTDKDKKGNLKKMYESILPLDSEGGYNLDKWATVNEAIKEWIQNPYELSEIQEGVEGGVQNASAIEETQEALVRKTSKELLRYLKAEERENRNIRLCYPKEFEMGTEMYKQAPTAIVINKNFRTVETIRYKSCAATGLTRELASVKAEDFAKLQKFYDLYADKCYVVQNIKELAPELCDGKNYTVINSFYFMKKTSDKKNFFDPDFFEGSGNSVVSINETHCYGESEHNTELDDLFASYIEQIQTIGFECEKDDCRYCDYRSACEYTKAPVQLEKKEVKQTKIGTPSVPQQEIIDTALDEVTPFIKVNAGAGSGKTFTMTALVVALLKKGIDIRNIFVTSFTNAGVTEIKERIAGAALSEGFVLSADDMQTFTFDGFYYNLISQNYKMLGFPSIPKMLKADMQKQYVEELVNETTVPGIDYGRMDFDMATGNTTPFVINAVARAFDIIQTYHLKVDDLESEDKLREKLAECGLYNSMSDQSITTIFELYGDFDARLNDENLITFSHLQELMEKLLVIKPDLYEELEYKYIIVDEFQDSNDYQVETIKRLSDCKSFFKLIVVGDDAQAIYGFRDTTPEYIINFEDYIQNPVKDMYLLENRRSTPEILDLANQLVALNENRVEKDLVPVREHGKPVFLQGFHSKSKEREFIVTEIKKLLDSGEYNPEDICVIGAKRAELADIGTRLSQLGIPWISKNPMNLLTNSKVKAALSLCDAFYNPEVTSYYFNYLVAKHDGNLADIPSEIISQEINYLKNEFSTIDEYEFEDQRRILHDYLDALKEIEHDELYEYFLELLYDNEDFPSELEYSRVFKKYGSAMEKKMDQNYVGVTLVTAHSSKGLEWPVVFNTISSYDASRLHHGRQSRVQKEVEEKRRLLFVSMTRARDLLYLTGTYVAYGSEKEGFTYNQFLHDLYVLKDMVFDPVDHEKEAKKAAKAAEAKEKRKSNKKSSSKAREMTTEEKREYDRMVLGSNQMSIFSA